jgi:hypothetical protein
MLEKTKNKIMVLLKNGNDNKNRRHVFDHVHTLPKLFNICLTGLLLIELES